MATFASQAGELLELHRPLYRLCGAGYYWSATLDLHVVNNLGKNATAGNLLLYA